VAGVVGALVPLVLVLALRAQPGSGSTARDLVRSTEAPISMALTARASGSTLSWPAVDGHGARVQYVVYRVDTGSGGCTAPLSGARECLFKGAVVATTRDTSFTLPSASGTYRIAAAANYRDEQNGSDLMLLGPPVTVP
jgi:hypothetical protein